MNKYLIIAMFLIGCTDPSRTKSSAETPKASPAYNVEKDKWLNAVIDNPPLKKVRWNGLSGNQLDLYFPEVKISISHRSAQEYVSTDSWDFSAMYKDGRMCIITSYTGVVEHQISPATYARLKCLYQSL